MREIEFPKFESLHNHTVISDGQQSHVEVLDTAAESGFGLITFTDHDILPRPKDLASLEQYDGPVQWNVGIEISSGLPRELGGGPASLFHILGIRIDHTNDGLQTYCQEATDARFTRLAQTVHNLRGLHFAIELDDCLALAGEGSPASYHVAEALLSDGGNVQRLEAIAQDMQRESSANADLARKYEAMMHRVRNGLRHPYVYELLLKDNAFIPGVYVPSEFRLEMDETVKLIRGAGGLAIIAHWPAVRETITEQHLERITAEGRIDGLELRTAFNANPTIASDISFLAELAQRHNLVATVGIDGHEPEDFARFTAIPGAAEMTIGQWDRITMIGRTL